MEVGSTQENERPSERWPSHFLPHIRRGPRICRTVESVFLAAGQGTAGFRKGPADPTSLTRWPTALRPVGGPTPSSKEECAGGFPATRTEGAGCGRGPTVGGGGGI